jgi:hypothetical protein
MFTKRTVVSLIALIVVLAGMTVLAKDNTMGVAEKQTIQFTAPTLVGGTLLPAGTYNVTHQMAGQTHVMIFKQTGGTAQAKANCTLLPLKAKAERTEKTFTTNGKNERVLTAMTFEGDKATHVLTQ